VSGNKAAAGVDNLVGHYNVATSVQITLTHPDCHTTGLLAQRSTATVSVARQDMVALCSPTRDIRRQRWFVLSSYRPHMTQPSGAVLVTEMTQKTGNIYPRRRNPRTIIVAETMKRIKTVVTCEIKTLELFQNYFKTILFRM